MFFTLLKPYLKKYLMFCKKKKKWLVDIHRTYICIFYIGQIYVTFLVMAKSIFIIEFELSEFD